MGLVGIHAVDAETGEWGLIAVGGLLGEASTTECGLIEANYEVRVDPNQTSNADAETKLLNIYHNREPLRIKVLGSTQVEDEYYEVLCRSFDLCRTIDQEQYLDLDLVVQHQLEPVPTT